MKFFALVCLLLSSAVFANSFHFHEGVDGNRHCYLFDDKGQVVAGSSPYGSEFCAETRSFVWSTDKTGTYHCFAGDLQRNAFTDTDPVHEDHCAAVNRWGIVDGVTSCYPADKDGNFLPGAVPEEDWRCHYVELYPGFWIVGGPY